MQINRSLNALVALGFVAALTLSGCVLPVKPPTNPSAKPSVSASESAKAPAELEGAVEIEGAYGDGSMWAKVGPVYRLENGVSALALTAGFSDAVTRFPARATVGSAVGQAMSSVFYPANFEFAGIYLVNDTEVFEPTKPKMSDADWVPQDPSKNKNKMHDFEESQKGGLTESVLVPFGDVGADTKSVGVSVGLIGFAGDVPVVGADEAPKKLQSAFAKLPDSPEGYVHAPYSSFTKVPGMGVSSSAESLDVTLAADVFFDTGKWDLKPESQATLAEVAKALATHEKGEVSIVGHTDNVPEPNIGNQALSENRANAVKTVLEGKPELAGFTFVASGKGESQPVAPNDNEENKAKNRRVQVSIKTPVKKEILELQATQAAKPPAAGQESTWPEPVVYQSGRSSRNSIAEINASEAIAYENYTLVTFTVKSVNVETLWGNELGMGYTLRGEPAPGNGFWAGSILRGEARTSPLEYLRPFDGTEAKHAYIAGAQEVYAPQPLQANDVVTFPVLYPPTKDKTITIDADAAAMGSPKAQYGWRINDVPVKSPSQSSKSGKTNPSEKPRQSKTDRKSDTTTSASYKVQ